MNGAEKLQVHFVPPLRKLQGRPVGMGRDGKMMNTDGDSGGVMPFLQKYRKLHLLQQHNWRPRVYVICAFVPILLSHYRSDDGRVWRTCRYGRRM